MWSKGIEKGSVRQEEVQRIVELIAPLPVLPTACGKWVPALPVSLKA